MQTLYRIAKKKSRKFNQNVLSRSLQKGKKSMRKRLILRRDERAKNGSGTIMHPMRFTKGLESLRKTQVLRSD